MVKPLRKPVGPLISAPFAVGLVIAGLLLTGLVVSGCSSGDTGSSGASTTTNVSSKASSDPDDGAPGDGQGDEPRSPFETVEQAVAFDRPVVLAHAGGENTHPHSTMFAYGQSVKAGVDILDFDVRLTKDGVLVVFHDDTVDRTTGTTGRVDQMTWDELHALDAAYWFTEECSACKDQPEDAYIYRGVRTGETKPPAGYDPEDFAPTRLADVIERYPDYVLNVEIKGSYPESVPVAEELAKVLAKHDKLDSSVVTAFDDQLANAFHEISPGVEITPGLEAMTQYVLVKVMPEDGRRIMQIPPDYQDIEVLTPELVERAHADGMVLWIWPNSRDWENAEGYTKLLEMGVDGLNAANPEAAVETVRSFAKGG